MLTISLQSLCNGGIFLFTTQEAVINNEYKLITEQAKLSSVHYKWNGCLFYSITTTRWPVSSHFNPEYCFKWIIYTRL